MSKYELLHQQLLHEGTCDASNFFEPAWPQEDDLLAIHTEEYVSSLQNLSLEPKAARKIGFPLSKALVEREHIITQGTIEGTLFALENGIAMNIAGGTHHAHAAHGEAFCLFNDQAIGARYLQRKGKARKILIIDLDVHQGNGTAHIFKDDPSVFTFSMHGANNYPFRKEKSDLDIPLEDGTEDTTYLELLRKTLPKLLKEQKPDFIFYLSGVDILATDKLGKLGCTIQGCKERDRFVLESCKNLNIPIQISMGGGYSPDIKIIIQSHANTYRSAQEIYF